jgi:hypothetical protein
VKRNVASRPNAAARLPVVVVRAERLTLGNLAPAPGSRRQETRKGRGYAAGQVNGTKCLGVQEKL